MARCQICGKRGRIGRISRHRRGVASRKFAQRASKKSRRFGANLQKTTFYIGGLKMTMIVCSRCLKKMRQKERGERKTLKSKKRTRIITKKAKKDKEKEVKTA